MRMRNGVVVGAALMAALAPLAVSGQTGKAGPLTTGAATWPAPVFKGEPDVPPPLSPADAIKTFAMPPGYHLQLVASEPLIKDPILLEYDGDGRLWVGTANGLVRYDGHEFVAYPARLEQPNALASTRGMADGGVPGAALETVTTASRLARTMETLAVMPGRSSILGLATSMMVT